MKSVSSRWISAEAASEGVYTLFNAAQRDIEGFNQLQMHHCLTLCVLTVAPSESKWWWFSANQETGFTEEMRMIIACD